MDILRLPFGEPASIDVDCLRIEQQSPTSWRLSTSALCKTDEEEESVSIVGNSDYPTSAEAEEAGLRWAGDIGVETLYVCVGTLEKPLRLLESDLPGEAAEPSA